MPRQDSVTDQMRDVMRYAVESGCYDAHDWLVKAWGARHGICGHEPDLPFGDGRKVWCVLTAGHDGAHENDGIPNPCYWFEKPSLEGSSTSETAPSGPPIAGNAGYPSPTDGAP